MCACLHASMICSCEAARADENEAMMANAAHKSVAKPRHALRRLGMDFPDEGTDHRSFQFNARWLDQQARDVRHSTTRVRSLSDLRRA